MKKPIKNILLIVICRIKKEAIQYYSTNMQTIY